MTTMNMYRQWVGVALLLPGGFPCAANAASPAPAPVAVYRFALGAGPQAVMLNCIPPGTNQLGSTAAERAWAAGPEGQGSPGFYAHEGEAPRWVAQENGFWLGRTEVTRGEWSAFVAATGYVTDAERAGAAWCRQADGRWGMLPGKQWRDPNWVGVELRDDHPVVCISWNDARAFCAWLTRTHADALPAGYVVRLPTEVEWEFACRGGRTDGAPFWWGHAPQDTRRRTVGAPSTESPDATHVWAATVGARGEAGANAYGLHDMLGNVWEWCLDGYLADGASAGVPAAATEAGHALRGGSFFSPPGTLRCASRAGTLADGASADLGFRVCLGPAAPDPQSSSSTPSAGSSVDR